MEWKIRKQVAETVEAKITKQTFIPTWVLGCPRCDKCGFHIEDSTTTAIQLEGIRGVKFIHDDCVNRRDG